MIHTMNKNSLKITILSISLISMSATAVSSSIADIAKSFPNAGIEKVMSIVTLPSMLVVLSSLFGGWLASFISKKKIVYLGLILFTIGGVGPAFSNNLNHILIMRGLFGAGVGLIGPIITSMVADFFEGRERTTVLGLQSTFISIGAMVLGFIAGYLGAINWHFSFWIYFTGLAGILLTFFFLPDPERKRAPQSKKTLLPPHFYVVFFLNFLFLILLFSFFTNLSIVIVGDGIGNTASAGNGVGFFYASGILAGIVFGRLIRLLKVYAASAFLGITGLGFALLGFTHNFELMMAASVMVGFGFAIIQPYIFFHIAETVRNGAVTQAIAVMFCISNTGIFISPFVFSLLLRLFDKEPGRFPLLFSATCLIVGASIAFLIPLLNRPGFLKASKETEAR